MAKPARKNGKNDNYGAALWTVALLAAALLIMALSAFLSLSVIPLGGQLDRRGAAAEFRAFLPPELQSQILLRIGLSVLNIGIVVYLLFTYIRQYLSVRAGFTLGIIAFLFSFLLYALSQFPFIQVAFGRFGFAAMFSFIPLVFSALGLLIFAKLGNE